MEIKKSEELLKIFKEIKRLWEAYVGSPAVKLAQGICGLIASLELGATARHERTYNDAFISSASLDALIRQYGQVIPYNVAKKAIGTVYITGTVGRVIPYGSEFETPGGSVYSATQDVAITVYTLTNPTIIKDTNEESDYYIEVSDSFPCASGVFYINGFEKEGRLVATRYYFSGEGIETVIANQATGTSVSFTFHRAVVPVQALEGGTSFNKEKNEEMTLTTYVDGINPDTRSLGISGGTDDETHLSYLEKCLDWAREPAAYFTTERTRTLVFDKLPNILFLESREGTDATGDIGKGKVKIFACDRNYELGDATKEDVHRLINQTRPMNMSPDDIIIEKPIIKNVSITIKALNPSYPEMEEAIRKNLDDFFTNSLFFNVAVSTDEIQRVIYDSRVKGRKVINFTLESAGYTKEANTLLRLRDKESDVVFTK